MTTTLPTPESLGLVMPQADRPMASYTGGIAQTAQESIGTAVSGVGDAATRLADELQTRHDQVATDDAVTQFQNATFKRLYGDPNNPQDQGYYGTKGQDALNGRAPLLEGLESDRQAILQGLGSNAQRQGFNLASRRLYALEQERAGAHANQQANVYGQDVQEASQNISLKQIGADPTNDDIFNASLAQGSRASRNKAMLTGGSPEVADAAEADYRSHAYATRTIAMAGSDPTAALTFLKANQKEFNPQSYFTLQGELQTKSRGVDSGTIANGVMNGTLGTGGGSTDGITGAILGQEHSGPTSVSVDGARGTAQIMPGTFKDYAKPGESFDNETDRLVVGKRVIADLSQRFNGDPARIAVGYFSGPGNVAPANSPTPYIADKKDGNGTTTSAYVSGVLSRLGPQGGSNAATGQTGATTISPSGTPELPDRNTAYQRAMDLTAHDPVLQQLTIMKMDRQFAMEDKVKKDNQEKALDEYVPKIISDPTSVDIDKIAQDTRIDSQQRWRLREMLQIALKDPDKPAAVSHQLAVGLVDDIRTGKMTDMGPAYDAYKRGLTNNDFNFVQGQFKELQTDSGQRLDQTVNKFLQAVKPSIDKSNPLMGKLDMSGGSEFFRLQQDLASKIADYRKAGKDPFDLLNPSRPDFIGSPDALGAYQKSVPESLEDFADRMRRESAVASAKAARGKVVAPAKPPAPFSDPSGEFGPPTGARPSLDQIFGHYR